MTQNSKADVIVSNPCIGMRQVHFELNGAPRTVSIKDEEYSGEVKIREKANAAIDGDVGAPMPVSFL